MQAPYVDPLLQAILQPLFPTLPLVGREMELQIICYLLDTVTYDLPKGARALTLSGEVGIGKTRLLARMCDDARERGLLVLQSNAYETTRTLPYFPFIEALRPLIRSFSSEQLAAYMGLGAFSTTTLSASSNQATVSLTGTSLVTALARLFPELPALLNVEPVPELLAPDQEKFRLLDAVATLLERVATTQPVLLCVDNLQWADSASLELTLYLTVRLRTSRVALVGVTRPMTMQRGNVGSEDVAVSATATAMATRALTELIRQGLLLLLPLGPLTDAAALLHLQALLPGELPAEVAQTILARAEGNPFFLEELVRTLTDRRLLVLHDSTWQMAQAISTKLPESVTLAIRQRFQSLSKRCLTLLSIAAQFGRTFSRDALLMAVTYLRSEYATELRSLSTEHLQTLLNEAMQASLITETMAPVGTNGLLDSTPQYIFCQGLVHEVLVADMLLPHLRIVHEAIGQALEEYYGFEAPAHADELARHYVQSNEQRLALQWSLLAGEEAARQQAHREAIHHFRVALRLLEGASRNGMTGRDEAVPTPRNASSEVTPAQLYLTIGELWFRLGELAQAITALQHALEHLPQPVAPLLLARLNRTLSDAYRMQGHYDQAMIHLEATQRALQADTAGSQQIVKLSLLPERSFVIRNEDTRDTRNPQEDVERVQFLQAQALLNVMLNRGEEAEQALWQSHKLATSLGDRNSQAFALHFVGWIRGWGQRIFEAIRLLQQANELYIALGDPFRAALGDQLLGIIYQAIGKIEQATHYTQRGLERANRYGVRRILGWLYFNQAVMALAQGAWETSEAHLQAATQEAEFSAEMRLEPVILQTRAELQFRRGNWNEAEQLFQDAIQASMNTEWYPGSLALHGHFLAVTGQHKVALVQLERASAYPEPLGFGGHYYIPFLAEGYLHLQASKQAAVYIERIRNLHGFLYYGTSVDRILGEVAIATGDWQGAEQAFTDALALCRRTGHYPEVAAILYEQARAAILQGESITRIQSLCTDARTLFLQYDMQRAATLVDTLVEGVRMLDKQEPKKATAHVAQSNQYTLHLNLTEREREVLRLVAEGYTDREVADKLYISIRTANRHLSNIFVKLDTPGRAAAVAYAIRNGLV